MVTEIVFLVQGSVPEPYEVIFRKDGDKLTALCTCPAGVFNQICKHRLKIMSGDQTGVVSENLSAIMDVQNWITGTNIGNALLELHDAESQLEEAKKRTALSKKRLAYALGLQKRR